MELIKINFLVDTPRGKAIWGDFVSNQDSKDATITELNRRIKNIETIAYQDKSGKFQNIKIKDIEINFSISDAASIAFLLGNIELPEEIKEGTIIYRAEK